MKSANLGSTVLDSNALLDLLEERNGAARIERLIKQASGGHIQLLLSLINWGEVYYIVLRKRGLAAAERVLQQIAQLPIQVIPPDSELTKLAAGFHVQYKLPYADCFAAALAEQHKAKLVTGDRDFEPLARRLRILWTSTH